MNKKLLIGCGVPLIAVIGIGVIAAKSFKAKPVEERFETIQSGDVEIKVVETGTVEPLRKLEVKSKVGGRLSHMLVDAGAIVSQGQSLATIDPQEINSQVDGLKAQRAAAQARLSAARKNAMFQQSSTSTGIAQYREALSSAKFRKDQASSEAASQSAVTRQSIIAAEAGVKSAQSQLKALKDNLNLMTESSHPQAVVNAKSAYNQAAAQELNALRNLDRQKQLNQKGFVSQQSVDTAQTDYDISVARTSEANERFNRIKDTNRIEVENMQSQIEASKSALEQQKAVLLQTKASNAPFARQQEYLTAKATEEQAKSQLTQAKAGMITNATRLDDVAASEADVRQLDNRLKELLIQQNDTTIYASMAGMITKRYVEQGELVTSAIGSFSQGNAIFQLADLQTLLVKININEVDVPKIRLGMLTEVTIDAVKGEKFLGKVRKISPSSQDSSSTTSAASTQSVIRYPVEIQLDKSDPRIKPGMSAHCSIINSRKLNVVRIPLNCLQGEGYSAKVQIVTEGMKDGVKTQSVALRTVKIGLRGDDFIEVKEGLKAGEKLRPFPFSGPKREKLNFDGGPPDNG